MPRYGLVLASLLLPGLSLAGCGGEAPKPEAAAEPNLFRTVIEAEGIPFEVSWDRNDRSQATARVFGAPGGVVVDPSNIVIQATGCRVTGLPVRVATTDDIPTYTVATNCAPAEVRNAEEAALSRELAREIDLALTLVAQQPVQPVAAAQPVQTATVAVQPAQPVSASEPVFEPVAVGEAPALFEGSPFAAFTATDIERYCAEGWETRIGTDGRTEYNPCTRRDAFR